VWDHVRWQPELAVADPWITLAAVATGTERVRLGPMVTPLARRRPVKVARETATLDRLSGGRLTLGVGHCSDQFGGEFSVSGEELDDRRRARMLDESLDILTAAWSGEPVDHRGEHYTVDGVRFLPRPVLSRPYRGHRLSHRSPRDKRYSRARTQPAPSRRVEADYPLCRVSITRFQPLLWPAAGSGGRSRLASADRARSSLAARDHGGRLDYCCSRPWPVTIPAG
jgi:hypothetical protein